MFLWPLLLLLMSLLLWFLFLLLFLLVVVLLLFLLLFLTFLCHCRCCRCRRYRRRFYFNLLSAAAANRSETCRNAAPRLFSCYRPSGKCTVAKASGNIRSRATVRVIAMARV